MITSFTERNNLYLRMQLEQNLHKFFLDTFSKDGLNKALFLLKESPAILSEFVERYEKEFERVLLSEQDGNGD